jgi:transcriptional regulator with XRE-family HTH domain
MITREQCRAARALLDWSQQDLAERAKVGLSTVRDFEKGRHTPHGPNIAAIIGTLEAGGVAFLPAGDGAGPGVRLAQAPEA